MISCHLHDYIEIACMYQYPIVLTLINESEITGIAVDTQYNEQKQHCIKIKINHEHQLIVLDSLKSMQALNSNPHFDKIEFS